MLDYEQLLNGLAQRAMTANENYALLRGNKGSDYDYAQGGVAGTNGHYTDVGKLPNHPTFSVESKYSNDKTPGGVWGKTANGQLTYTPSVDMIQKGNTKGLAEYMTTRESDVVLMAPVPYRQPSAIANHMLMQTTAGQDYARNSMRNFEAQDKGLVEASDVLGLAGAIGPVARSVKNYVNAGNVLYKPASAGWGAFILEQGLENGVQNQLQEKK